MTSDKKLTLAGTPTRVFASGLSLISSGIPASVVDMLVLGDRIRGIEPGALEKAILAGSAAKLPESPWGWWAGANDEWFTVGPAATREAVIEAAIGERLGECELETPDGEITKLQFHVVEAKQDPVSLGDWIDFDRMIEDAEDSITDSDRVADGDTETVFDITPAQQSDLESRIKAAIVEWQLANNLMFKVSTFSHMRNRDVVTLDLPAPEADDAA